MNFSYNGDCFDGIIKSMISKHQQNCIELVSGSDYSNKSLPSNIFFYNSSDWSSSGVLDKAWLMISFPFYISLTHYSIRSCDVYVNSGKGYLLAWVFDGSADGKTWEIIEDIDHTEELKDFKVSTRSVNQRFHNHPLKYFRFKMKKTNYDYSNIMRITNIEFFGDVGSFLKIITCYKNSFSIKSFIFIIIYMK